MLKRLLAALTASLCWGVVVSLCWFPTESAVACSSCGSGGDDPLILYPNETYKMYVGLSDESGFRNIQHDGAVKPSYTLVRKRRLVAGAGLLLTPYSFVTLVVPYVENQGDSRTKRGFGDPALTYRYTFFPPDFSEPLIPQLQLILGLKPSASRSVDTSRDPRLLDAFGSGFDEAKAGFDLWSGMTLVQYGFSHVWAFPRTRSINGSEQNPGVREASTLTVGYASDHWKMVTGLSRNRKSSRITEGQEIDRSEEVQHNIFLTFDWKKAMDEMWRLTFVDEAAVLRNTHTHQGFIVTLAYMRSFQ